MKILKTTTLLASVLMVAVIFTSVSATAQAGPIVWGDFDGDGLLDGFDADILTAEIVAGSVNLSFDMNGDGIISPTDLDEWFWYYADDRGIPLATALVDVNFDQMNTIADFQVIQSHLGVATTQVTHGDLYADGFVDATDMNLYISRGGVIPEPATMSLLALGGLAMLRRKRVGRE